MNLSADPWLPRIEAWLATTAPAEGLSTSEVLAGALGLEAGSCGRAEQTRAGKLLGALGFERKQVRVNGTRVWRYFRGGDTHVKQVVTPLVGGDSSAVAGVIAVVAPEPALQAVTAAEVVTPAEPSCAPPVYDSWGLLLSRD